MKLCIVGGGGFRVPQVFEAVTDDKAPVRLDEVALFDVDPDRLAVMRGILAEMAGSVRHAPRVTVTTNLDEALVGCDFVFSAIRVGGSAGRIKDERVALDLGVLGQETIGPGGLSYAMRTLPVALHIARRIRAVAPGAWTINFTNPAGIVTEAMRSVLGDRVIGICDTPIGLMRRAREALDSSGVAAPGSFDYVGLNHLGWLRRIDVDGRDRLPELIGDDVLLDRIEEARLVGQDWVRTIGALPNEYLYYYYYTREATAKIGALAQTRGELLHAEQSDFFQRTSCGHGDPSPYQDWVATHHRREATYMRESRADDVERRPEDTEGGYQRVALDLMAAIATDRRSTMILNVANRGLVPQLDDEAIIEVGCEVDGSGVHPWPVAPVEGHMLGLMTSIKAVEQTVIEAVTLGSEDLAWKALAIHPLVDSVAIGKRLLDGYRDVHPELKAVFG